MMGLIFLVPSISGAGGDVQITAAAGIGVWLDDDFKGKTPEDGSGLFLADVAAGSHSLRAARNGYVPLVMNLTVEDNRSVEVVLKLSSPEMQVDDMVTRINEVVEEESGTLLLRSLPLNANILFDGQSIGLADKKLKHVPPGKHSIRFVHKGKELKSDFMVNANEILIIKADFAKGKISRQADEVVTGMGPVQMVLHTAMAKKPAAFPHKKHQDMFECAECHHSKDDKNQQTPYVEGMKIQKCVACHNDSMANKKLNHFKLAAHARCKGCHKKAAQTGKAGPVIKCSGCHPSRDEKQEAKEEPRAQ